MAPKPYYSQAQIAEMRHVSRQVLGRWRGLTVEEVGHPFEPFPEPDVVVGGRDYGWSEERLAACLAWKHPGPGRGKGAGRPKGSRTRRPSDGLG